MQTMGNKGVLILLTGVVFAVGVISCMPFFAEGANSPQEQLRAEFRSALLSDPRSASLSDTDVNAMVEALAGEAEAKRMVEDFVLPPSPPPPPAPTFSGAYLRISTPWGSPMSEGLLYGVVLGSLFIAGMLLWLLIHLHHRDGQKVSE